MDWLVNKIKDFCKQCGFDKIYWVGYSGGLDSHVLLHAMNELRTQYPLQLRAIHINHQLSPFAAQWSLHCSAVCHALRIDFVARTIVIPTTLNKSPEELAREVRYAELKKVLQLNDFLLTAHHIDDQAETVLMQMLRGAGPKGLAAMPLIKPFARGFHGRPLLEVTRDDFKKYATHHNLSWIEDESNLDVNLTRNFLRHDVLPILKKRWPSITSTLSRVAKNCGESCQVLDEIVTDDLIVVKGSQPKTLSIQKLVHMDAVRQRQVLRAWLRQLNFSIPSLIKMQHIQHDILNARSDKTPLCTWQEVELRRYQDDLYAMLRLQKQDVAAVISWNMNESIQLPNIGELRATPVKGRGLRASLQNVSIRFRQGGEKLKLPGRIGHHSLKKLFQEWQVPPWERTRTPLIYVGETLAAVVGYDIHEDFIAKNEQEGHLLWLTNA